MRKCLTLENLSSGVAGGPEVAVLESVAWEMWTGTPRDAKSSSVSARSPVCLNPIVVIVPPFRDPFPDMLARELSDVMRVFE